MSSYGDVMQYILDLRDSILGLHERISALEETNIYLKSSCCPMPTVKLYPTQKDYEKFTFKEEKSE